MQWGKVASLYRAQDDALVTKEIFRADRETILQFLGIADSLPVDLVLGGAQHGGYLHDLVVVLGPPYEFVLPSRLALDIENAPFVVGHAQQAGDCIVGEILFIRQRAEREMQTLDPSVSGAEKDRFHLGGAVGARA